MATKIDSRLAPQKLRRAIERLFEISAQKILSLEKTWKPAHGAPVLEAGITRRTVPVGANMFGDDRQRLERAARGR